MAKKKLYQYTHDDLFWDTEIQDNVFIASQYYPMYNPKYYPHGVIVLSVLDDDHLIKGPRDIQIIRNAIYEANQPLKKHNIPIAIESLNDTSAYNPGKLNLKSFIKRYGLNYNRNPAANRHIDPLFYPIRDTDPQFDPNADGCGHRFAYNQANYDTSMLAYLFDWIPKEILANPYQDQVLTDDDKLGFCAHKLRQFNNKLFTKEFINHMSQALTDPQTDYTSTFQKQIRNYRGKWAIRKSFLMTNRFTDIARLNEHMQKIALKRIMGMLGLQILESDRLSNNTAHSNDIYDLAELVAYNVSDTINQKRVFEHPIYQNNFSVKNQLIKEYPQVIYDEKPDQYGNKTVRKDRMLSDSTSAQFINMVIAPYNKLSDISGISYKYPSDRIAKDENIKQINALDDTFKWAKENIKNGEVAFGDIYDYYKQLENKNVNASLKNLKLTDTSQFTKDFVKQKHADGTNKSLYYFYRDKDGKPTSSIVNFSIGGLHGAEIKLKLYEKDYEAYEHRLKMQKEVRQKYNDNPILAHTNNDEITFDDGTKIKARKFLKSGSTRKKAQWKDYKAPRLIDKDGKIADKYTYTSVAKANHEDFSSYYPLLLHMLSVFYNEKTGKDAYSEVYHHRLALKAALKQLDRDSLEYLMKNLLQTAYKLLLNSASGAGDATFDSNIRKNNAVVSMRIIGQLFAWRIGQAEALAGARVPSTNTDGLYTMGIDEETNNKILFKTVEHLHLNIEPEVIDRFVTKDSNNRMEFVNDEISSAKGGSLTSHQGPNPDKNLAHPAINDYVLAQYLAKHDNPADQLFNRDMAYDIMINLVKEGLTNQNGHTPVEILRYMQWIISSSRGSESFNYLCTVNRQTKEITATKSLQQYNRIFLVMHQPDELTYQTIQVAKHREVQATSRNKRLRDHEPLIQNDPIATKILKENGFNIHDEIGYEARNQKVTGMPNQQPVIIYNPSLYELADPMTIITKLNFNSYLDMIERTFYKSWCNLSREPEVKKRIKELA